MEGEKILMSQRQLQRLEVMGLVEAGKITLKEGAEKIGMSYRQTIRIRKRVQEKGGQGLIHGNTGNPSNHRMKEGIKAKVLKLSQKVYGEFNDQHFTEKLAEEEGIEVSRETVRKMSIGRGLQKGSVNGGRPKMPFNPGGRGLEKSWMRTWLQGNNMARAFGVLR